MLATMPSHKYLSFRYNSTEEAVSSTILNQITGVRQFKLNSMYDPDHTGIGHQPLGYDEWTTFYNRYRVFGAKVTITVANQGEYGGVMVITPWMNTSGSIPGTFLSDLREQRKGSTLITFNDHDAGGSTKRFSKYYSINKILGVPASQIPISNEYVGVMGNFGTGQDPATLAYVSIGLSPLRSGAAVTCNITVDITYYAKLEAVKQVQSS